jgi:NAD(P)-dependent dehydrogenase (short-subunit alcohol dehydrogenase family)
MSKSAIIGLTKGLARDLGPRGITVNNVQPGPVDTDMNPESREHSPHQIVEEENRSRAQLTPREFSG